MRAFPHFYPGGTTATMKAKQHLTSETALDFLEERLDDGQLFAWREHIDACVRCSRYLAEWQKLLAVVKRAKLKSVPQPDREKAIRIFPHRSDQSASGIRRILATTVFDSLTRP